jgi:hypothetical protein
MMRQSLHAAFKPKISPSIIELVAVDMLDLAGRPLAGHMKPRQIVGEIILSIDLDMQISVASDLSCGRRCHFTSPLKIIDALIRGRRAPKAFPSYAGNACSALRFDAFYFFGRDADP